RGDGGRVPRWLVPYGRSRRRASRRLHGDQGSRQGHHHLGWREHLEHRGGDRAEPASRRADGRGRRAARREVGRDTVRVRAAPARRHGERGGDHRILPRQPASLRRAQDGDLRPAADDGNGEDPEVRAARAGSRALDVQGTAMLRPDRRSHYAWGVLGRGVVVVIRMRAGGLGGSFGVFIKPMEAELGWSRTSLSIAAALSLLVYGLVAPFAGRAADLWGARTVFSVSLAIISLGAI